jgi:hypothetical protein
LHYNAFRSTVVRFGASPRENGAMTIEPDTKNWTWVLERRCDECGFDARAFPREHVGALVREQVPHWQSVLRRPGVSTRSRPDRWSPLEYACHVRDVFRVYDGRLARMLAEDGPAYANWDQDATAAAERYGEQDPETVAGELAAIASVLADRFDSVTTDAQWRRSGYRSDGAAFTVETFARYFVHDLVHHVWDVGATGSGP